ncbi:alpha/beta hydrolase [Nanoarchaeota archaeon]
MKKETIKIDVGDTILVGTLYKPKKDLRPDSMLLIETGLSLNRWTITARFAEALSQLGMTAFAYDRRSHNESSGKFISERLPEDIDKIIDHFVRKHKKKKFGMFGFCFGGIPATYAAVRNKKIKALALVNSYPEYGYMERKSKQWNIRRARYYLALLTVKLRLLCFAPSKEHELHVIDLDKGTGLHYNPKQFLPELINGLDARKMLPKITIPTLFIQATKDKMVNKHITPEMFSTCGAKDKRLFELDDGHFFKSKLDQACKEAVDFFKANT